MKNLEDLEDLENLKYVKIGIGILEVQDLGFSLLYGQQNFTNKLEIKNLIIFVLIGLKM